MTSQERRTCYVCKKLFCCATCRERHEEKKHTKRQPNCPFCANEKVPLKAFEDQALLYHIVTTHLPLYCYLCGETFKQSKDLESLGTCKWWKSWHRFSEQKSILGTPPLTSEGKESSEYNGKFGSLTSPPELYRNTSTPMVVGQKTSFDFKTPNAPNFSLKTSKIDSASVQSRQTCSGLQGSNFNCDSSNSNYMSLPSASVQKSIPLILLPSSRGEKEELSRNKSQKQDIMKEKNDSRSSECYVDNNCVEDMELTNIENDVLPDSQSLEVWQGERRSESLKKVRFSDEYETPAEHPTSMATFNQTENEEYFEACDTLSEMKVSLEKSQIKIYEDNARNMEKENNSSERNVNDKQQSSSTSRVVMMVVVENDSNASTSDLINSGLRKLNHVISNTNFSTNSQSYSSCSSSLTSVDSYYSYSNDANNPPSKSSNTPPNNNAGSSGSTGFLSVVTNAVKSVIKNFSALDFSKNVEEREVSSRENIAPTPSVSESSALQRPGKRPRDVTDPAPSMPRQTGFVVPQNEIRSPLAKRYCGWYNIKGRKPIARMRDRQHLSPRGVSSETQVFHQGSLSVGNTILPLPDRAHQSTQTE